ncbi:MAG: YdeI/OmpD-associated family protein [Kiritimatiellia bacterium]
MMEHKNKLDVTSRQEFRAWLEKFSCSETECYVCVTRGRPVDDDRFWYLDAVEEALCFGWIDSTIRMIDGKKMQRFSPRRKNGNWTELNKVRVRRLEKLGLMTDAGRAVLPAMEPGAFTIDKEVEAALKNARVWSAFKSFHPLYQRIRASNLAFYKKHYPASYGRMLKQTIENAKKGKTCGNWNDYGRLLEVP